ncbi:ABC-three component system middle component 8 [Rathayibacter sp. Leaf296]|uniref:ABC-three component system middle component 8 n=1 Tax=Rathayibacter sp. Leaf296 TaxID=1736327 RepID=UPI0009ECBA5F
MLVPTKHSHPDQTVVAASAKLLRELRKQRVVAYDDLRKVLLKSGPTSEFLFTPATSLLFLLGLISYLPKTDSFEYRGK